MTRTLARDHAGEGAGEHAGVLYRVHEERDVQRLLALLGTDRAYAAFAIGHLDRGLFEHARFWTAEGPAGEHAVVMHANGPLGRMSVLGGDAGGVAAALHLHPGPRGGYLATFAPEHLPAVQGVYAPRGLIGMVRMSVDAEHFRPTGAGIGGRSLRRLNAADTRALNALYATGGGPTGYRGEHIEQGVYYGAFDGAFGGGGATTSGRSREGGSLVAAAGTHLVSPGMGIAVVGNVFTHAEARGRGLATRVTSAVTADLLARGCWQVTLTVDPDNAPALRAYDRLGYVRGAAVHEARFSRRDVIGLGALLRRRLGKRGPDGEYLVRVWPAG